MLQLLNRMVAGMLPAVPKPVLWRFSRRYIAGPTLEDALRWVRDLNDEGCMATLDILGEDVAAPEETRAVTEEYLEMVEALAERKLDANISLKLTALGQRLDGNLCRDNLEKVLAAAGERGNFVRLDMEDSTTTSDTLALYRAMRTRGYDNVGVALQSYLRRSMTDADSLRDIRPNYRLCKGIYLEPRKLAFQDREVVRRNFILLLRFMFETGSYVGIATHDERVIWEAERLVRDMGVGRDGYEFQMLLGVDVEMRRILTSQGHRLRVYVPYGEAWRAYSLRRLRENPHIVGHAMRHVFGS